MFNFMKKAGVAVGGGEEAADKEDKERRKKEKKERKEKQKRERGVLTAEDMLRIDEQVRRSLKLRGRRKEKEKLPSGITADYSANFFAEIDRDSNYSNYPTSDAGLEGTYSNFSDENNHFSPIQHGATSAWKDGLLQSDSSETSLNSLNNPNNGLSKQPPSLPPLPPRPPKRGILKGPRANHNNHNSSDSPNFANGQDDLIRNTLQNEVISYQNVPGGGHANGMSGEDVQNFTKKVIHSPVDAKSSYYNYGTPPPITVTHHADENGKNGNMFTVTSPTPSAESLTDTTTNSSFATPPFSMSPTGDSDGFHRWSSNLEGIHLPLPEISPAELPPPRVLTIQRQKAPRNDFGFSLRRAMIAERCWSENANGRLSSDDEKDGVKMRAVIFAEPGASSQGHETGLLPGDRLLEVNGVRVDDKSREEIIDMIKSSHDYVIVKVQPVAELSELWRRWAANTYQEDVFNHNSLVKSDDEDSDKNWDSDEEKRGERVWVCHRGGFTAARKLHGAEPTSPTINGPLPRSRVQLITKETLDVDDDDLEKANPPKFDQVEDLAVLRYINESSALHTLRQRYGSHLVHTSAGHSLLLLINPVAPLNIYSDKVVAMFKGCKTEDTPPHLFAWAQAAHHATLTTRRDQALVFTGRTRAGKSLALRRTALYLAASAGATASPSPWTPKIAAALTAFGAFGSARGSRCVQLLSLHYDHMGMLASASLQGHMLDMTRIPNSHRLEGTFDIFNWLIYGCEGQLRRTLLLEGQGGITSGEESSAFARVTGAFKDLSISEQEQLCIWRVLAAIWHLCGAGAAKVGGAGGGSTRYHFQEPAAAGRAAQLLGCCSEELARAVFSSVTSGGLSTPTQPRAAFRTPSPTDRTSERDITGQEALEGLISGLYMEVFNCVIALINRCLTTGSRTVSSLLLVDPPGMLGGTGGSAAAGLPELAVNYLHERLQLLAHERAVLAPRAVCRQEGVNLAPDSDSEEDWIAEVMNPGPMVDLLDRAAQNAVVRTSQLDLRDVDRKGLFWLLDEESMHPGASDTSFLERAVSVWGSGSQTSQSQYQLFRRAPQPLHFVLHHMQGTFPVLYNAGGWLKASREIPVSRNAIGLLQESSSDEISRLFVWSRGLSGAGPDAQASLRRASSIRRTLTTGAVVMNRRSFVGVMQAGVETILSSLRRARVRFICCALARRSSHNPASPHHLTNNIEQPIDIPLLRSQFRGFQMLEAARMHKQGFPDTLQFAEFARRFRLLSAPEHGSDMAPPPPVPSSLPLVDQRRLVEDMLRVIDLDPSLYRLGLSQVLLRAGALSCLERARAERLRARITRFQALCRGVLARRALARRRVQEVAVRCIQRNVRAFLTVRDWPWWRLLVRITPLLAVHRTEDQLRAKTEELDTLRVKVEKLETERSSLKHENDKLENKLSEMTAELAVEQAAGSLASERLSAETAERLRLERDLQSAKIANNSLQHSSERLETELMYARAETNGSVASETGEGGAGSDSEGSGDGGRYKRRLQVALRELEAARRQLRQQHEDDLEQLVTLKKQLEKKAADAYEEAEEQRQVAAQWKRKAQKAASDANDVRLLLDEQGAKATILERRQRKFDAECQQVKEEARREKQTRERVQREHEALMAEKCALEQMLSDARLELEMKEEKLSSTQRELDDLTFGGKTEEEVGALKKIKHDLENKCHDQEEELDELAGQVQLLESHKVRLEMSLEQQRKASRLEAAQRDEELEEVRAQAAKKIKTLESQLEMEHNERTLVLRERHELERRLASLEESARADATERDQREQRNRRDLRRYKALARDAQVVLERREQDAGAKAQLRQLRDKLDDAEVALRVAQKARQVAEAELAEAQSFAEEASRGRREAELRATQAQRESASARAQLEEAEEEAADVMKKYRACVASLSEEQRAAKEASAKAAIAEEEARAAQEKAAELMARLASLDNATTVGQAAQHDKLELRTKELEASLELEQTARSRLEAQAARARDAASASAHALGAAQQREITTSEELRKVMRTVRELREELAAAGARCDEATRARGEAENRLEEERSNAAAARADLRATNQRLLLLQQAIADDISPDNGSDSENESVSSDESIETFLANHKLYPTANTNHGSETPRSNDGGRQSRSSNSSKQMSPVKESFA